MKIEITTNEAISVLSVLNGEYIELQKTHDKNTNDHHHIKESRRVKILHLGNVVTYILKALPPQTTQFQKTPANRP